MTNFRSDPDAFVAKLEETQILERMTAEVNRPPEWSDRLVGLFQGDWGSAVKGQLRARTLEDFTEGILKKVFLLNRSSPRCQFLGANGLSSEKADFAIPSAKDALILIEVKAFNATGSKQTDVLGDIFRIVEQKHDDTASNATFSLRNPSQESLLPIIRNTRATYATAITSGGIGAPIASAVARRSSIS